jgi:hypothetical protein
MATNHILTDTRCTHTNCHATHTEVVRMVRPAFLVEQCPTVDEKESRIPLCANHADEWRERDGADEITPELVWE